MGNDRKKSLTIRIGSRQVLHEVFITMGHVASEEDLLGRETLEPWKLPRCTII